MLSYSINFNVLEHRVDNRISSIINREMHSTGIEPVSTPWKGAILPLNYECVAPLLSEIILTGFKRTLVGGALAVGTARIGRGASSGGNAGFSVRNSLPSESILHAAFAELCLFRRSIGAFGS